MSGGGGISDLLSRLDDESNIDSASEQTVGLGQSNAGNRRSAKREFTVRDAGVRFFDLLERAELARKL